MKVFNAPGPSIFQSRALLTGLLLLGLLAPLVSSHPSDERLDIDLEMELVDVVMPVSTQDISELFVQGWVDVLEKPPAERVTVQLTATMSGQFIINVGAYPNTLYFTYTGRQYFNLTLRLDEDTPPGREYRVDVDASADARVGFDHDVVRMTVVTVPQLAGEAELFEPPKRVRPGGVASGVVEVTNTGTRYSEYLLSLADDPGDVVDEVRFTMEVEMTPNWVERAPFDVTIDRGARAGRHRCTIALLVINDDGGTTVVDRFDVDLEVAEVESEAPGWTTIGVTVLALGVAVAVAAFLLRRKA